MYYNNTDSKQYTESEIKALYPNTSFPSPFVAPEEYSVVFQTPQPTTTELQVAYQDGTEIDSKGNRVVKWSIRDMFSDTIVDGVTTLKAEHEAKYLVDKFKASVPQTLTPRQFRLALLQATLLDEIELMANTNKSMSIWFEYSLDIRRDSEFIVAGALTLGLTETQIDELFILGATL